MKVQDIGFLIILSFLIWRGNHRLATMVGLICLILAIPLFSLWIFFTAQRLVMYAAVFFALSIIMMVFNNCETVSRRNTKRFRGPKKE